MARLGPMSGDDGDANLTYALYAVVPVSTLLLFWLVASGFNVRTRRSRRQRLANEIARSGSNAPINAGLHVSREDDACGRATPVSQRDVGSKTPCKTRMWLDLELAESRSLEASDGEARGGDGSDGEHAASVGSRAESKSDVDSAFEASARSVREEEPRRAAALSYVREELVEMSGRYERLYEAAYGASPSRGDESAKQSYSF